ncbi:MAG: nitrate- and nitrite sensing domain-containing protein, partial [Betaproteobacteria bacterium]|nr:nitrate- and nitrite sensing domain-containing protein [Betaproteobacteria bacterium]
MPTALYINTVITELDTTKREATGTGPVIALQKVVQYVQQHRGIASALLNGNNSMTGRLTETQQELNKAVDAVDAKMKESSVSAQNTSLWSMQKQRIAEIQQAVSARQLKAPDSAAQHTKIVADLMLINEEIIEESDLLLDPVKHTYFLMSASMLNAPRLAENLGLMRATGTALLTAGNITDEGRTRLAGIFGSVNMFLSDFMRSIEKATRSDPKIKAALEAKGSEVKALIDKVLLMANQELLQAKELKLPANEYFGEFTRAIDSIYAYNSIATDNLVQAL